MGQRSVCVTVLACASRVCWSEPLRDLARSCVVPERVHAAAFPPCTTWLLTIHQSSLHVMTCQAATRSRRPFPCRDARLGLWAPSPAGSFTAAALPLSCYLPCPAISTQHAAVDDV